MAERCPTEPKTLANLQLWPVNDDFDAFRKRMRALCRLPEPAFRDCLVSVQNHADFHVFWRWRFPKQLCEVLESSLGKGASRVTKHNDDDGRFFLESRKGFAHCGCRSRRQAEWRDQRHYCLSCNVLWFQGVRRVKCGSAGITQVNRIGSFQNADGPNHSIPKDSIFLIPNASFFAQRLHRMSNNKDSDLWAILDANIARSIGHPFVSTTRRRTGPGAILGTAEQPKAYFVKLVNGSIAQGSVEAEFAGLVAMAGTNTVRVPRPISHGVLRHGTTAFLIVEYLDLSPPRDMDSVLAWEELGKQLARMHRCVSPDGTFGFAIPGTIGSSPQPNEPNSNWIDFYSRQRIGFQIQLGRTKRSTAYPHAETLVQLLPKIIGSHGHNPVPSLVHGDLWTGNADLSTVGPVMFDPSAHYADRETDLAMSELFGSFPAPFYRGYKNEWPIDDGYEQGRKKLYQLYHVMNHFAMFGGGYLGQAERIMADLISSFS